MTRSFDWNAKNLSLADKPIYWKVASTWIVLFIKCKCRSIVWRGLSIDLQPSIWCCSAMSHEDWGWQPKGGKSMLTLSNSRVSWKEGKPMQHWCCPLSSPYFCLYCTCDWHPNSEKTNAIQLCCPAPTDVCTFDIPFLGKPMQLHWCCLVSSPYYCLHSWAGFPPLCGSISQVGDSEPTNHEKGFVSDLGYICPQPGGGTLHFKDMLTRPLE